MSETATILIIDDDGDILTAAGLRLTAAGFHVLSAHDVQTGLSMAVEHLPNAILLDLQMMALDGLEALASLRQCQETAEIPVVVFSADRRMRRQTLPMGARNYIDKPYNPQTLLETVRWAVAESNDRQQRAMPSIQNAARDLQHDLSKTQTTVASFSTHQSGPKQPHLNSSGKLKKYERTLAEHSGNAADE